MITILAIILLISGIIIIKRTEKNIDFSKLNNRRKSGAPPQPGEAAFTVGILIAFAGFLILTLTIINSIGNP
jgi:hypothetical protein